jgi:transposase-like protein
MSDAKVEQIKQALMTGQGIRATAREMGASTTSVMRIARSLTVETNHQETVPV